MDQATAESVRLSPTKFGEWLSLVEHLVRDQGVGGSNPLSPTIFSLALSIVYTDFWTSVFSTLFGTFGTADGNSKPTPHCSAHFLRNATSSLDLVVSIAHVLSCMTHPVLIKTFGTIG